MVGERGVRVGAVRRVVGVDRGGGQAGYGVDEGVFRGHRECGGCPWHHRVRWIQLQPLPKNLP